MTKVILQDIKEREKKIKNIITTAHDISIKSKALISLFLNSLQKLQKKNLSIFTADSSLRKLSIFTADSPLRRVQLRSVKQYHLFLFRESAISAIAISSSIIRDFESTKHLVSTFKLNDYDKYTDELNYNLTSTEEGFSIFREKTEDCHSELSKEEEKI